MTPSSGGAAPALPSVVSSAPSSQPKIETVGSVKGSVAWRAVLVRHSNGQEVLIAASLASVDATDAQLRLALLVGGGALVIILAALWWWLIRLGLNPIAEVTSVADAITGGDRSRRVHEARPGSEAGHLARAFNVMLDEEQATEDHLRRFVADASHELRTPVTVIQGVAELWQRSALRGGSDRRRAPSCRSRGRADGRASRGSASPRSPRRGPAARQRAGRSLATRRDVLAELSAMYPSHPTVDEIDEGVTTTGDGSQLRQVLSNLLSNAYAHTPSGTRVGFA